MPAQVHSRDPSHSGNVSAPDRAKQFKETIHEDGGKRQMLLFKQLLLFLLIFLI